MRRLAIGLVLAAVLGSSLVGFPQATRARAATAQTCPADLTGWRTTLGADWIDCHQVADLTTTGNPWTDKNQIYGMGGSGLPVPYGSALESHYTNPASPAVSGVQIDGYFHDDCDAYQVETAATNTMGQPFLTTCQGPAVPGGCLATCHHDASFLIRIPDAWDGHMLTAGGPGIRDQFSSDFVVGDYALEKRWAYVAQDKGNMGANFFQAGCDERGTCTPSELSALACTNMQAANTWCGGAAINEWTFRMRQATRAARALLNSLAPLYSGATSGVTYSYAMGASNGGYQTRRALESDVPGDPDYDGQKLYDGGLDWEGTLLLGALPSGVLLDQPTTGFNIFQYLPTALQQEPGAVAGNSGAVAALSAVGFNAQSQPLWPYHYGIYWALTQQAYREENDPEYTSYACGNETVPLVSPCVEPPETVVPPDLSVPPGSPDAVYNYGARVSTLPAVAQRLQRVANTGKISVPMITLHGDQDALLPIRTDSDLYAQMVHNAGHDNIYRYYVVQGGNHVDPQFDDHFEIDAYGNTVSRPILPCARAALDALTVWVEQGVVAPASHTIARPVVPADNTGAAQLANTCDITTLSANVPEGSPTASMAATLVLVAIVGFGTARFARRRRPRP